MAASQVLPDYLTLTTRTAVFHGMTQTIVQTVVVQSALPTQQLPDYLSASTFLTTVNGQELTATTIVDEPLTYIGPSIPLGTNGVWTYLGSTTPASLLSSTQSSSSTATPSSSSSLASSLTASTSSGTSSSGQTASSSNSPSATTSNPTSTTPSPATSSAAAGAAGSHLSTGQIIGIVIASIIAFFVLILLAVLLFFRYRKRRYGSYHHPNNSDFVIVDSEGLARVAGEGSPRPTGEEGDSFLRGSGETVESAEETLEVGPGPGITARLVGARAPPSPTGTEHSTGTKVMPEGIIPTAYATPTNSPSHQQGPKQQSSPFFHASASSLFFNPSRGPDRSLNNATTDRAKRESGSSPASSASASPVTVTNGKIITTRQLREMDDQWQQEADESAAASSRGGLRPGPTENGERQRTNTGSPLRPMPSYDTNSSLNASYINSLRSGGGSPNDLGTEDERTMLLTARRFNMSEAGPSTFAQAMETNATSSPSSWHSSLGLGLGGLARLSGLSWFQRMDAHRSHSPNSRMPTTRSSTPPMTQLRPQSNRESVIMPPRPMSHVTTSSTGDTVFYEAPSGPSSLSTRASHNNNHGATQRPTSMPPLPPRAVITGSAPTASSSSAPQTPRPDNDMGSDRESIFTHPALRLLDPALSPPNRPRTFHSPDATPHLQPEETPTNTKPSKNEAFDILDTPVPARAAVSPFSSTSTRGGPEFPPGLEHLSNVRSWRESSSDMPSSATFGSRSTGSNQYVNIDVVESGGRDSLEDDPPLPTANWTQLRAVTVANAIESNRNRRLAQTFNLEGMNNDIHSNEGSLHSFPDRLSPLSPLGSGSNSRAPSRQNNSSLGSKSSSSRSPLSHNGTYTSLGSSHSLLNHSNSITEHGRRRPRREPGEPVTQGQGAAESQSHALTAPGAADNDRQHFIRARLSAIGGYKSPPRTPASDAAFVHGATAVIPDGAGAIVGRT